VRIRSVLVFIVGPDSSTNSGGALVWPPPEE